MIIPLIIAGVGLAMSAYSAYSSSQAQGKYSEEQTRVQGEISKLELQAEAQRRQQMELGSRRQSLELFRGAQRARALALTNATSQGASQGSGLQGGYGQISGDAYNNALGINQNLQIGRNIFDINAQISPLKAQLTSSTASYQTAASTAQGIGNIGGSLMNSASTFGKLFPSQPAFGSNPGIGMGNFMAQGSGSFGSGGPYSRTYTG